jgi:hypothetical protein
MDMAIELNGVVEGSAPGTIRVDIKHDITIDTDDAPSFHKTVQSFWANA